MNFLAIAGDSANGSLFTSMPHSTKNAAGAADVRQAQGFKPICRRLHATLMPQFKHGQAQSDGRASSMPRGSLRPNLGLNRKGHCHGSIRLQERECRSWVHRLQLARQFRRSGRADLTARTNTARRVE